jgi:hypothetical protein
MLAVLSDAVVLAIGIIAIESLCYRLTYTFEAWKSFGL